MWAARILGQGFFWKLLGTSLAGAIGGSGYVALVSKYANFYYAWTHGFRIPAEGSPYLQESIGAISFASILVGLSIFLALYLLGQLLWYTALLKEKEGSLDSIAIKVAREEIEKLNTKAAALVILASAIVVGIAAGAIAHFNDEQHSLAIGLGLAGSTALLVLVMWRRKILVAVAGVAALLFASVSPILLFNEAIYSRVLRELGYGGGLPVTLSVIEERTPKSVSANLYLRTNTSLFVSVGPDQKIEFLLEQIKSIQY